MSKLICKNGQPSKLGVNLFLRCTFGELLRWINPISRYYPEVGDLIANLYNILHSYKLV